MRIWVDPAKLVGFNLSMAEVNQAISAQNVLISGGSVGSPPNPDSQRITATVTANGQLSTIEGFGKIVLRANTDGSKVLLRDVARIEVGADNYQFGARLNGKPTAAFAVVLSPNANALATAQGVRKQMDELAKYFPGNITYSIPYDTAPYVKVSIEQVLHTLVEAMVLVFLVMYLFLQNVRYTLIPALVVPVAMLGTFAVMLGLGFSINVLTMFAMVLAIGILVDDAIVVVENVGAHHGHRGPAAQGGHQESHAPDQRRHRRHHAGAGDGVPAAGLHGRVGGRDLPPVLGGHGRVDLLLGWR